MSARLDFFFRQKVTEAELDLAFALLEKADRDIAADLGVFGIVSGAVPSPHTPVPDLTVDLTAPARAYDHLGQRLFFGTGQTVDCGVDHVGIPTDVATANQERWLGIFLRFKRLLSEPRTDGNSQQVYFRRDESFELVVRQAPQAPVGVATKVALQADEILVCDVRRRPGQTQIVSADIDVSRRQVFIFAAADSVSVEVGTWNVLAPAAETAQATFDEVDAELRDHFTATGRRHAATAIDNDAIAGAPNALAAGNARSQLAALVGMLNAHANAASAAHNASAIAALTHNNITTTTVQAQLQEIVNDLLSSGVSAPGAGLVGIDAIAGSPTSIAAGTLRAALVALLGGLNGHATQANGAHAASAISVVDAPNNLNATTVEAALTEVLEAFKGDHFRSNDSGAGQHRTIRQPALGGSKALILDSSASGSSATRLRIYADGDSVWFTVNASWDGSAWARDMPGAVGGFSLSRTAFAFLYQTSSAPTFDTWSRVWTLPMSTGASTAFEVVGAFSEVGRCGVKMTNPTSGSASLSFGACTTFRARFPAAPSSVTLAMRNASGSAPTATVESVSRDGFALTISATVLAGGNSFWFGDYTAFA